MRGASGVYDLEEVDFECCVDGSASSPSMVCDLVAWDVARRGFLEMVTVISRTCSVLLRSFYFVSGFCFVSGCWWHVGWLVGWWWCSMNTYIAR